MLNALDDKVSDVVTLRNKVSEKGHNANYIRCISSSKGVVEVIVTNQVIRVRVSASSSVSEGKQFRDGKASS